MSVIKVGLLGLGTVGTGVYKTIELQQQKLSDRLGKKVEIVKVLVRDIEKERIMIDKQLLTSSFDELISEELDVIVEVMGGIDPTFDYIYQAFQKGCHVVTANKELLAKRGRELIKLANHYQVHFFYEASVAGGIPVVSLLRQFLQTNDITKVQGILNGTTNYILSQMEVHGKKYEEVLKDAQRLGYAEADPTSDVEGYDALFKLYILSQLVFGEAPEWKDVEREGISGISSHEVQLVKELGLRYKLIASAEKVKNELLLSVQPSLISFDHSLASISDANNAVYIHGNIVGDLLLTGKGAGEFPTASAVVEDIAFLLTQEFSPQQEWRNRGVQASVRKNVIVNEQSIQSFTFLYLDSKKKEMSVLYHVLECVEKENSVLQKVHTIEDQTKDIHIALLVQGDTSQLAKRLEKELSISVKKYPIIGEEYTEKVSHITSEQRRAVHL